MNVFRKIQLKAQPLYPSQLHHAKPSHRNGPSTEEISAKQKWHRLPLKLTLTTQRINKANSLPL